jgi:hypothetical protein
MKQILMRLTQHTNRVPAHAILLLKGHIKFRYRTLKGHGGIKVSHLSLECISIKQFRVRMLFKVTGPYDMVKVQVKLLL